MSAIVGARTRAEQLLAATPEAPRAVCTDIESKKGETVFVGIAIRGFASVLVAVGWDEWGEDWERNLALITG